MHKWNHILRLFLEDFAEFIKVNLSIFVQVVVVEELLPVGLKKFTKFLKNKTPTSFGSGPSDFFAYSQCFNSDTLITPSLFLSNVSNAIFRFDSILLPV